jgi:sulfur-oxidizing protein SoxX
MSLSIHVRARAAGPSLEGARLRPEGEIMSRPAAAATALFMAATLALCGCEAPRKSAAGFHLPDGDPVRGRAAFVELRCHACHSVAGVADLPKPVADPPLPFALGGPSAVVRTDGEMVTAILEPSHRITMASPASVQAGRLSRMGDFTEAMTVRQLIDLVAFVHAHTEVKSMVAMR